MALRDTRDLVGGLFFVGLGAVALHGAARLATGTAAQMGPGYFPRMLAIGSILLGLALVVRAFTGTRQAFPGFPVRAMLLILGGSLCFAVLLRPLGLIPAVLATVIVGSLASREMTVGAMVLAAVVLTAGTAFIFSYALGLPMPLLGTWLRF